MGVNGNGVARAEASSSSPRVPRRVVVLADGEDSEAAETLAEYRGADISGVRLHSELQKFAAERPGRLVAAEWLGPLGWTRFLWCKR